MVAEVCSLKFKLELVRAAHYVIVVIAANFDSELE